MYIHLGKGGGREENETDQNWNHFILLKGEYLKGVCYGFIFIFFYYYVFIWVYFIPFSAWAGCSVNEESKMNVLEVEEDGGNRNGRKKKKGKDPTLSLQWVVVCVCMHAVSRWSQLTLSWGVKAGSAVRAEPSLGVLWAFALKTSGGSEKDLCSTKALHKPLDRA